MLFVTEPFLPPLDRYQEMLKGIWERNHLTNNGPLVQELERKIPDYLGSVPMQYLGNGTIALQIALKALNITKEVITTPFSYVATTSSIVWEGCTPIFADIDPKTWNISPESIEACITDRTEAILATHVFGNPCDVKAIDVIANRHGLKVIYDAAHAFGSTVDGVSIFNYGDMSTASFHATKLFHTTEGGAIFCGNEDLSYRVSRLRNFGHSGPTSFDGIGVNGKNSEFHAAMGLCNLDYIERIIQKRRSDSEHYRQELAGQELIFQEIYREHITNHSYFPVVFSSEEEVNKVLNSLASNDITPRRYFYPSLDKLEYITEPGNPVVAHSIAERILCLPLSYQISKDEISKVCSLINEVVSI